MTIRRIGLVFSMLLAAGCDGDPGAAGAPGPEGPAGPPGGLDPSLSASDKLVVALGGAPAVTGLTTITATIRGERLVLDEGYLPDEPSGPGGTFDATLAWDVAAGDLRLDYQRTIVAPIPGSYTYSELLRADGGWRIGIDNLFGVPGGALPSERWGSARRQQTLLHPEVIARGLATGALTARDAGVGVLGGVLHHLLEVADPVAPLTLWIEIGTGRLAKITTIENEHLRADVPIEVLYADWSDAGGGLRVPHRALITVDGELVHDELRTALTTNAAIPAATFAVPDGGHPVLVASEALRGERSHQFYEIFSGVGIPLAGDQTQVVASEIKPGVWYLTGGSHNSLVIEQATGIVLVEAPLYAARSEALLAWIAQQFPGKPVSHVIATHFHGDHAGGLRTLVANGTPVIAGDAALGLYRRVFAARRTIEPDRLATAPRPATLLGVAPDGHVTLPDAARPVQIYPVTTTHAADMLVAVASGVLFVSDLFSPGIPASPQALRELRQAITDNPTIAVERIAGGHGGTATLAELDALIAASAAAVAPHAADAADAN
jgi:glyoxylase-like metal-dependent hydrolase (beta-lactamase superfamily II)